MENEDVKTGWVAMLVSGNSLSISGKSFKLNIPMWVTPDLVGALKKFGPMFKIWQQPLDQPLPQLNMPLPPHPGGVSTKNMKPQKVEDLSQQKSAKDFLVRPTDVEAEETIEVAGTETAEDSWPSEEAEGETECEEEEGEAEAEGEETYASPQGKINPVAASLKKKKAKGK